MTENTRKVFNGWVNLTQDEKNELATLINDYEKATPDEKRRMQVNRSVKAVETGPYSTVSCVCCGR